MSLHPGVFFLWREGKGIPIPWWPLRQPLEWYRDQRAQYVIACEHICRAALTYTALVAGSSEDAAMITYDAIIWVGHRVADYHQGLFARELRDHLDDHGCLIPRPTGGPWYHPPDGHRTS